MKKIFFSLFVFSFTLVFYGCSDDDEKINLDEGVSQNKKEEYAPDKLQIGTYVNWWGVQIINGERYSEAPQTAPNCIRILNSTDCLANWSDDWGTYSYTKTGKNNATLSFSIVQSVLGHVRHFNYTLYLKFKNEKSFDVSGHCSMFSTMNGSIYYSLDCVGVLSTQYGSNDYVE